MLEQSGGQDQIDVVLNLQNSLSMYFNELHKSIKDDPSVEPRVEKHLEYIRDEFRELYNYLVELHNNRI